MDTGRISETYTQTDLLCTPREPLVVLNELLQLKRESIGKKFLYRQLILIDEFLATYPMAFYMSDLIPIMELLEKLVEDLPNMPQYHIPLQLLFARAENLPLLRCSSDILKYEDVLKDYFNLWSYFLLEIEHEDMLYQVAKILLSLLTGKSVKNCPEINKNMIMPAVEKSYLPFIISELLLEAEDGYYEILLKVGIELTLLSPKICETLIVHQIICNVILRLDPNHKTRSISDDFPENLTIDDIANLQDTMRLLWYIAEGVKDKPRRKYPELTQKEWTSFRYTITILIKDQRAKLERNFLVACLLKTYLINPSINLYSTRLPEDICKLCTNMTYDTGDTWTTNIRHSKEILDYNFKKLMLFGIGFLAQIGITESLKRWNILGTLIKLINPETNTQWQTKQYCKILHIIVSISTLVTQNMIDEFIKYNGPIVIIGTLNYYKKTQYEYDILKSCMRLTWTAIRTKDKTALEMFKENGIVTVLTDIGNILLQNPNLSTLKQDCLIFSFSINELILKDDTCPQIDLLKFGLNYLNRLANPLREDGFHDSKVAISCISCLWECIKSNEDNLKYFVSNNGVYVLLDVIEKSLETVQIVGLGMLVDLCEDESVVPYILTWRKDGRRYINLLLDIIRKENKRLKVKIGKSGVIKDIYHPLMGERQYKASHNYDKPFDSSPSIMDMYGSSRPKVYAIIQLLRRHEDVVSIVNERYKIQTQELSVQDEITMLLIENFLSLKLGEVWCEIAETIRSLGTQLVGFDDNLVTTLRMKLSVIAQHVQKAQIAVLEEKYAKEEDKERSTYEKLKKVRLGASLKAMSRLHYVARTTESLYRMIQKMRQRTFIDTANLPYSKAAEHHNTFQYSINVNPVFHQQITMYNMDNSLIHTIKEVSPCNSKENLLDLEDEREEPLVKLE